MILLEGVGNQLNCMEDLKPPTGKHSVSMRDDPHLWFMWFPSYLHCSVNKGKVFPYSLPSVGPGADPVYRQSARRWI